MNIFELNDIDSDDIFCRQVTQQDRAALAEDDITLQRYRKYSFIVNSDGCPVPDLIIPTEAGIDTFHNRGDTPIILTADAAILNIEYEGDLETKTTIYEKGDLI